MLDGVEREREKVGDGCCWLQLGPFPVPIGSLLMSDGDGKDMRTLLPIRQYIFRNWVPVLICIRRRTTSKCARLMMNRRNERETPTTGTGQ